MEEGEWFLEEPSGVSNCEGQVSNVLADGHLSTAADYRAWAEDPVGTACSVVDLPELAAMEARSSASRHNPEDDRLQPPFEAPLTMLGVPFNSLTLAGTVEAIQKMIASGKPHYIATANVDFLVQARSDVELHRSLLEADLVLCDGQPLVWASRWLGHALPERVAGSDLVPELIRLSGLRGYRIFFLGGTPQSAAQAVANIHSAHPTANICGYYSPPFSSLLELDDEYVVKRIRDAKPDLLFVALGCPKAEKWMFMHRHALGVPVAIGIGGTIDFLAGRLKRAPRCMRRTGTEWLYRLAQEPRRLFSRYARDARCFGLALGQQLWRFQWRCSRLKGGSPAAIDLVEPTWRRIRASTDLTRKCIQRDNALWSGLSDRHCLLDLSEVRSIDSTGLGLLIALERRLAREDFRLILLAPSERVRKALESEGLGPIFLIATDTLEARDRILALEREKLAVVTLSTHSTLPLLWKGTITAGNVDQVWAIAQAQIESFPDIDDPITIDLSGMTFIDSAGAALLSRVRTYAGYKGATVRFLEPSGPVRNVLRASKQESVLVDEVDWETTNSKREEFGIFDHAWAPWHWLKQRRVEGV